MVAIASTQKRSLREATREPRKRLSASGLSLRSAGIASGSMATLLTADAMLHNDSWFDVRTTNAIQRIDLPYIEPVLTTISTLTGSTGAVFLWAIALTAFTISRRWLPALAMLTLPIGGLINHVIGEFVVGRTRPDPDVVTRTVPDIDAASFPSGHVMGAVMFYGMIIFLAQRIQRRALRVVVQATSFTIIAAVGFTRVWEGAHWPTDVLGAYAFGGLFLVSLFAIFNRIEASAGHLPFIRAGEIAHDDTRRHAHALTSVVFFNPDGTVTKVYNPGFLPRALYWLAFQAPFPYERNRAALEAAQARRNLAGLLTEYWYGENRVARVTSIDVVGERLALSSELVEGHAPGDRAAAKAFLVDLRSKFEAVGLPTWQIDARQPRAVDNILETADGHYVIVDLESGLVSPLASARSWWRAIRRRHVPIFDTVYFDVTRTYVAERADQIRESKGDAWLANLEDTLDRAEATAAVWYATEPRLWSVALTPTSWRGRVDARMTRGQDKAVIWMTGAIDSWEDDGRISASQARALRSEMETPQFQAVLPHFGAHVIISVLLRFPLGSIARVLWSVWGLGSATVRLVVRRIDRKTWRQAWSIHHPVVIAIAAIPGFGAFAYLASGPIRSNRLLMRVMLDPIMLKLPWRVYERSGMRRLVALSRAGAVNRDWEPQPNLVPVPNLNRSELSTPAARSPIPLSSEVAAWD